MAKKKSEAELQDLAWIHHVGIFLRDTNMAAVELALRNETDHTIRHFHKFRADLLVFCMYVN